MKFGKRAMVGGKWEYVELTEEEVKNAMYDLLMQNKDEINRCLSLADTMEIGDAAKLRVAMALAEKQMTHNFSYLSQVLEEKIQKTVNQKRNFVKREPEPKFFDEKSAIDRAMKENGVQ